MSDTPARGAETVALPRTPGLVCEDCGEAGVSWEDGVILCDDCAILRAKEWQMKRERTDG